MKHIKLFEELTAKSSLDEKWMALALEQARLAQAIDEVPVGAVLVQDGKLIASAHNQPISTNDATAHAEIQLLRISRVVFGAYDQKTGVCGSCEDLSNSDCINHSIELQGGILEADCKSILQSFFKNRRK